MTCDPIPVAEGIYDGLIDDEDFPIPDTSGITMPTFPALPEDLFTNLPSVETVDLTEGKVNGSGVFDELMKSVTAHMDRERTAGRLSNNDFTKAYVDFTTAAMGTAVQFLLQKDQAYWTAIAAQNQAKLTQVELVKAAIELEEARLRMQLMGFQAAQAKAAVATQKMALATQKVEYCTAEYNLNEMLPQQLLAAIQQTTLLEEQVTAAQFQNTELSPQQKLLLIEQVRATTAQAAHQEAETTTLLPKQVLQVVAQTTLVDRQAAHQLAETTNLLPKQVTQLEAQTSLTNKQSAHQEAETLTLLPKQVLQVQGQTTLLAAQTTAQTAQTTTLLPEQVRATKAGADAQIAQTTDLLPKQVSQIEEQIELVKEQVESQRAQTLDTRVDGVTPVTGVLGKQKDLQDQQIDSYIKDAQMKAARPFVDAWITQKTIDEGTLPPTNFSNATLDIVLARLRAQNDLT